MKLTEDKIGIREYIAIAVLIFTGKVSDDTPALLTQSLWNTIWMTPIIDGILTIIPLYFLLYTIGKYPNQHFSDIFKHLFGRFFGVIVLLLLWLISAIIIILDSAIYTNIIESIYYSKTPTIVIAFTFIGVSSYMAKRGLEQIGSVAWIFFPFIMAALFLAFILTIPKFNPSFLFPIFGPGEWEVMKQSALKTSSLYIDLLYLSFLAPFLSSKGAFKKGTIISFISAIALITIGYIVFVGLFDYRSLRMLNYPYHELILYIHLGFITNIETIFLPFSLIASFIRFAIFLYINALILGKICKIDDFERLIPLLAILFAFLGNMFGNPSLIIYSLSRAFFMNVQTFIFFILAFLLWLMAKIKGRGKDVQAKPTSLQ